MELLRQLKRQSVINLFYKISRPMNVSCDATLVIAPHPDDEVFGCGGLIALKLHQGADVDVIFLTNGEGAHRGCCSTSAQDVGYRRKKLAVASAAVLGLQVNRLHWFELPDGAIPRKEHGGFSEAANNLAVLLKKIAPRELYLSHPADVWPDHEASAALVVAARDISGLNCRSFFYPVWMLYGLRIRSLLSILRGRVFCLDISTVADRKQMAIKTYLESTNPSCGKPDCGVLPESFVQLFLGSEELFFESR